MTDVSEDIGGDSLRAVEKVVGAGDEHEVVVVSEPITDDDGIVIGTGGYCVDLTDAVPEPVDLLCEVLPEIVAQRAAIEQAKGILMAIYALSPDQAFQVLRWRSQVTNTKLRDLAAARTDHRVTATGRVW
ncbi:ANTAR domain-containing protein [Nocardia sp. CC227C]|uniref:ANTAR domain-containing protein n=1 Tax=Nocardia sp. CC227C TaxID=3044562 RepID=UPI00278C27A8|nr:ANTAR domain-containing protein [Nocardia sp. CC227C]